MIVRPTATAVPLRVWAAVRPPAGGSHADLEPARLVVGRVRARGQLAVAALAGQPRLAVVLLGRRGAEIVDRDVDDAVGDLAARPAATPRSRGSARAPRSLRSAVVNDEHLDLVELVHAEDPARVACRPRPPRGGSTTRSRRSAAAAPRRRGSRRRAATPARPPRCRPGRARRRRAGRSAARCRAGSRCRRAPARARAPAGSPARSPAARRRSSAQRTSASSSITRSPLR